MQHQRLWRAIQKNAMKTSGKSKWGLAGHHGASVGLMGSLMTLLQPLLRLHHDFIQTTLRFLHYRI
jgi:hypothetical protein